jgi:cysteinyl-tRNA synthetase
LDDASKAFERIEAFLFRVADKGQTEKGKSAKGQSDKGRSGGAGAGSSSPAVVPVGEVLPAFREAMDDDLGVPRALAVVHDQVRAGNAALAKGDIDRALEIGSAVRAMLAVLGLDPWSTPWVNAVTTGVGQDRRLAEATDRLIQELLTERSDARAARDYAKADAIRVRLAEAGFAIEDTRDGPVWSVAPGV